MCCQLIFSWAASGPASRASEAGAALRKKLLIKTSGYIYQGKSGFRACWDFPKWDCLKSLCCILHLQANLWLLLRLYPKLDTEQTGQTPGCASSA